MSVIITQPVSPTPEEVPTNHTTFMHEMKERWNQISDIENIPTRQHHQMTTQNEVNMSTQLRRIKYEVEWFEKHFYEEDLNFFIEDFCFDPNFTGKACLFDPIIDTIIFSTTDDYEEQVCKAGVLLELTSKKKYADQLDDIYQRLVACRIEYQGSERYEIARSQGQFA